MTLSDTIHSLELQRASILASIAEIGNLRSGFVREIRTKCGRPACHCMRPNDPGHGPYFQFVCDAAGKRTARSVSAERAAVLRREVDECQRLRRLTGELIAVSEQLSDARFASAGPAAQPPSKKKPAHSSSSPRSRTRSPAA